MQAVLRTAEPPSSRHNEASQGPSGSRYFQSAENRGVTRVCLGAGEPQLHSLEAELWWSGGLG